MSYRYNWDDRSCWDWVNDSLLLVSEPRRKMVGNSDLSLIQIAKQAALNRLRPSIATSLTTITD